MQGTPATPTRPHTLQGRLSFRSEHTARRTRQQNPTLPIQQPNSAAGPSQLVYKRLKGLLAALLHMYANSSESNCPCDTTMYPPRWHPHSLTNSTEPTKTLMSAATPAHGTRTNLQSRALPTTQQRDAGALTRHTCMAWHQADRDTPLNNHNTNTGPWQWQGAAGHTLMHSHTEGLGNGASAASEHLGTAGGQGMHSQQQRNQ